MLVRGFLKPCRKVLYKNEGGKMRFFNYKRLMCFTTDDLFYWIYRRNLPYLFYKKDIYFVTTRKEVIAANKYLRSLK